MPVDRVGSSICRLHSTSGRNQGLFGRETDLYFVRLYLVVRCPRYTSSYLDGDLLLACLGDPVSRVRLIAHAPVPSLWTGGKVVGFISGSSGGIVDGVIAAVTGTVVIGSVDRFVCVGVIWRWALALVDCCVRGKADPPWEWVLVIGRCDRSVLDQSV